MALAGTLIDGYDTPLSAPEESNTTLGEKKYGVREERGSSEKGRNLLFSAHSASPTAVDAGSRDETTASARTSE